MLLPKPFIIVEAGDATMLPPDVHSAHVALNVRKVSGLIELPRWKNTLAEFLRSLERV